MDLQKKEYLAVRIKDNKFKYLGIIVDKSGLGKSEIKQHI